MIWKQALLAESEILKFKRENPEDKLAAFVLFMKHSCGFDLYPQQILMAEQYFRYDRVLDVKPPRSGKTAGKGAVNLYEMATNESEDLRIYVPKFDQGKEALSYQYDWISKSPILNAYIRVKSGKRQLSTVGYEFLNGSKAKIYSVKGEIEGHNVSIMDIEEIDRWKWETFQDDVMRRGGAKNKNGLPTRIRISGTIMGQENIFRIVSEEKYKKLFHNGMYADKNNILGLPAGTILDVYTLLSMGVLDPEFMAFQKEFMSPDEWARSNLLKFTEATNFIWSTYLRAIFKKADNWGLKGEQFYRGGTYKTNGIVGVGFDCGHAGEKKESSKYSLQIYEQLGMYRRWLNGFEFPADVDITKLENDVLEILAYYRPSGGYADALGHRLISSINDKAWKLGLTTINRNEYPDNTPGNWEKWWLSPLWNTGKNKHFFYSSLQHGIHHATCYYPFYEIHDKTPLSLAVKKLSRSLLNIRKEETAGSYPRYYPHNPKIGDDDADAAGMANLWLDTHVDGPINFDVIRSSGNKTHTSGLVDTINSQFNIDRDNYDNF